MICTDCQTNYHLQPNSWRFEGCSDNGEGIYIVESEVFTPDILQEILEHAVQNDYIEISVDAYLAEYTICAGCRRLNIQLNREREALLDLPKYKKLLITIPFK